MIESVPRDSPFLNKNPGGVIIVVRVGEKKLIN